MKTTIIDRKHTMSQQTQRQKTGSHGEHLAQQFLIERGYTLLDTNWHGPRGELDIIAQQDDTLVFVEVRTRRTANTEAAFASITPKKRASLIALAHAYLDAHDHPDSIPWRIDVIGVALPPGRRPQIDHIEDALGW